MAGKNGGEQLNDLERGNTRAGSSSMNTEITEKSDSTPTEPRPTSVKKENTTPNENSKAEGGTGEGKGKPATSTMSKIIRLCLAILILVVGGLIVLLLMVVLCLIVLLLPVYFLIMIVYLIVHQIAAPKKWTIWVVLEWIALVGIIGFLIASLTSHNLKNHLIWELELWKWCILLMAVVCGKLISQWIVNAIFLLIHLLFANNLEVYCLAYGLKEKNRVFVWCGLVLIAWLVLVVWFGNRGGTRSEETKMILDYVTKTLISLSIGAGLWLLKDLLLWLIVISFLSKNFFEKILKARFYKFVIEILVHPSPLSVRERYTWRYGLFNWAEEINKGKRSVVSIELFIESLSLDSNYRLKPELENGKKDQEKENDAKQKWGEVLKRKREPDKEKDKAARSSKPKIGHNCFKNACWNYFKDLANLIKRSIREEMGGEASPSQSSEPKNGDNWLENIRRELKDFVNYIKRNTRKGKGGNDGQDILESVVSSVKQQMDIAAEFIRFVKEVSPFTYLISSFYKTDKNLPLTDPEVDMLFENKRNLEEDFKMWQKIVKQECDSLESSLDNTRRGMEELNKLAGGIVLFLILIVWLLVMKVLSSQAVALILSQFFVLTFVFGDTCKRIFEGIMFVFVTHPFDVGDRCLIEGREDELFVKEINIQRTVFSRDDPIVHQDDNKEEIMYPNSVLATKHICNFHKIPKLDSVEFVVDASTSIKQIEDLNSRLRKHIEEKGLSIKDISVHANGFEDGDKIKMGVYVTYKDFWKDNGEKTAWKSKIVLGLKQILEEMGISKYSKKINVESAAGATPPAVV